jgi:long-subunit fatty acid transport protein
MHRKRIRLAGIRLLWIRLVTMAVCLAILAAAGAEAQPVTIPRFDFSFSNPGARSLGFAGAFAALADDATAAYANPAGLVQLTRPEVSFEARLWNRSPSFIAGGRAEGEPTGQGIDTRQGICSAGTTARPSVRRSRPS